MTRNQYGFALWTCVLAILWVFFLSGSAHGQQVTGRTLAIGPQPSGPQGSSVRITGIGTENGPLFADADGDILKRLLIRTDLPAGIAWLADTQTFTGANTFGLGLTAPSIRAATDPFAIKGANNSDVARFSSSLADILTAFQATGATTLLSTLRVNGASQLDSTLLVSGATALDSTLGVLGVADFKSPILNSTGVLNINDAASVANNLNVLGAVFADGGSIGSVASELKINPSANLRLVPAETLFLAPANGSAVVEAATILMDRSHIQTDNFASRLTGWRVGYLGDADFRTMFSNELKVTTFTNDITQATNGDLMVTKAATTTADLTFRCPAPGEATVAGQNLVVDDYPSMLGARVFSVGDWVTVQNFTRTDADADGASSLDLSFCVGQVSGYVDSPTDNTQTWTFTRGTGLNGGGMTTGQGVPVKSAVINYGTPQNGIIRMTANDGGGPGDALAGAEGSNSPYISVATWTNSPAVTNWSSRARIGNLRGITSTDGEYGMIAGTYSLTNGRYFRSSNMGFELHGIDLSLWDSTNRVIRLTPDGDPNTPGAQPSFALGFGAPTGYGVGTGVWMGKDTDGVYKLRIGTTTGSRMTWDGTNLTVAGIVNVLPGGNVETITGSQAKADAAQANATAVANTKETPPGAQAKADVAYNNSVAVANTKVATNSGVWNSGVLGNVTQITSQGIYIPNNDGRIHIGLVGNVPYPEAPQGCNQGSGGIWMGQWDVGDGRGPNARFCVGNSTNYLSFDGYSVRLRGGLNADDIVAGTLTGRVIRSHTGITGPTGAGLYMDWTGSAARFYVGNGTQYFKWDGAGADIKARNMIVDTDITTYGSINFHGGNIRVYDPSFKIIANNPTGTITLAANFGVVVDSATAEGFRPLLDGRVPLGRAGHRWDGGWFVLPQATAPTYVVVGGGAGLGEGQLGYRVGVTRTIPIRNARGIECNLTLEAGIITASDCQP